MADYESIVASASHHKIDKSTYHKPGNGILFQGFFNETAAHFKKR
jgi:hypothetical protein